MSQERQANFDDHDYEEPYFVPASEEEQIIGQIRALGIPEVVVGDDSLRFGCHCSIKFSGSLMLN